MLKVLMGPMSVGREKRGIDTLFIRQPISIWVGEPMDCYIDHLHNVFRLLIEIFIHYGLLLSNIMVAR